MSAQLQNSLGILATVLAVAATYWIDARYIYKRPTSFPAHFLRTGFFPRRALAYSMTITVALTIFASIRNGLPRDHAMYATLNNVVNVLIYPLLFFIAAIVLVVIKIAIFPIPEEKV